MRQTTNEKIDPLMRIQEEIKEVVRREQEYRQLVAGVASHDDHNGNGHVSKEDTHALNSDSNNNNSNDDNESAGSLSISPIPPPRMLANNSALAHNEDLLSSNTPSLELSVTSKESLDEHHSDDSGISASSSPINGKSTNGIVSSNSNNNIEGGKGPTAHRYIGPNCYTLTPEPPQQKLMTRTVSTPHLAVTPKPRQFAVNPAHRGVMQRFIASRGKMQLGNSNSSTILLNGRSAAALITAQGLASPTTPLMSPTGGEFGIRDPTSIVIPTATLTPAVIERDGEGKPIRPGYTPVEVKIQRELNDLKTRESELKKIRKIRESTSDLLASIENENIDINDDDDSDVEHCYGPGKLRSAKSNGELCESTQSNNIISPRASPTPDQHRDGGLRPALSLAQLCDLDPEEAPSSHRLIAQWESLIQQNA